jgi:predicted acetyltransferase
VRTLALLAGLAALVGLIAAWRGNAVGRRAKAMVLMMAWPAWRWACCRRNAWPSCCLVHATAS